MPLGGWEEFYPDLQPSAPSGGNLGGATGRPLNENQALDGVWFHGNPPPTPPAVSVGPGSSLQAAAPDNSGVIQNTGELPQGGNSSLSTPGVEASIARSGSKQSQLGPPPISQQPVLSYYGADNPRFSPPNLEALAGLGIHSPDLLSPNNTSPGQSGSQRSRSSPRTPDPASAGGVAQERVNSPQSSSLTELEDLRSRLRGLRADNGTSQRPSPPPFFPADDGSRSTHAGTYGDPSRSGSRTTSIPLLDLMDVDTSNEGDTNLRRRSSSTSERPVFSNAPVSSTPTQSNSPTRSRRIPERRTPPRPLRRIPRRRNLRSNTSSSSGFSWATGATRGNASPRFFSSSGSGVSTSGSMPGKGVVTEQVFPLYWPLSPERQRHHGGAGLLRRMVEGTRRLGRTILVAGGRRGQRDRQRAALRHGVSREEQEQESTARTAGAAGAGTTNNPVVGGSGQGATPTTAPAIAGYAGLIRSPFRGREVFYIPPLRGYVAPGFRRADWWWHAAGGEARRYTYFYDAQSAAAQRILDAARQGIVPVQ